MHSPSGIASLLALASACAADLACVSAVSDRVYEKPPHGRGCGRAYAALRRSRHRSCGARTDRCVFVFLLRLSAAQRCITLHGDHLPRSDAAAVYLHRARHRHGRSARSDEGDCQKRQDLCAAHHRRVADRRGAGDRFAEP